jgi:hypothetical protein
LGTFDHAYKQSSEIKFQFGDLKKQG